MIKKTYQIIKRKPKILLALLPLAIIPVTGNLFFIFAVLFREWGTLQWLISGDIYEISQLISIGILMLASGFAFLPSAILLIDETIDGCVSDGWFRRGFHKHWRKVGAVNSVLCAVVLVLIYFGSKIEFFTIFPVHVDILFALYIGILCFVLPPIAKERKFSRALKESTRIGITYSKKLILPLGIFMAVNVFLSVIRSFMFVSYLSRWAAVTVFVNTVFIAYLFIQSMIYYNEMKKKHTDLNIVRSGDE